MTGCRHYVWQPELAQGTSARLANLNVVTPRVRGWGQGRSPALHPIGRGGGQRRSRAELCPPAVSPTPHSWVFSSVAAAAQSCISKCLLWGNQTLARRSFNVWPWVASVVPQVVAISVHSWRWACGQSLRNSEAIMLHTHVLSLTWVKRRCFKRGKRS